MQSSDSWWKCCQILTDLLNSFTNKKNTKLPTTAVYFPPHFKHIAALSRHSITRACVKYRVWGVGNCQHVKCGEKCGEYEVIYCNI